MVKTKTNNSLQRSAHSLFLIRLQSPERRFLSFQNLIALSTLSIPRYEERARNLESLPESKQSSSVFQIQFTEEATLFCWYHTYTGLFKTHGKDAPLQDFLSSKLRNKTNAYLQNWSKIHHIPPYSRCMHSRYILSGDCSLKRPSFLLTCQKKNNHKPKPNPPFMQHIPHCPCRLGSMKSINELT